jgi:type I restriction enzyme, S subunit
MGDRRNHHLGEFVEIQTGPFGSQLHAHDYVVSGTPMVMPTNIGQRLDIVLDEIAYVSDADISRLERYLVKAGDIVYSRRGDVEKCAYITEKQNGWLCGGGCLRIRVSSGSLDSKFLAYYLSTRESKSWILNSTVGSTMPNLNSSILLDFPLRVPPIDEQRAIAEVLSSLDDKIDLLHRQNKTLERLAETLFRQWFIEKADPSWKEGLVTDEFDFVMGQSPRGESFNEEGNGVIFYQGRTDFGFRFPEPRVYTVSPTRFAEKFDTLVSVRAPVGDMNMALERCCLGRGVAAFRYKDDPTFHSYTYYKMRSLMNSIKEYEESGTVFGSIGKEDFKKLASILPDQALIHRFQTTAEPIDSKIFQNTVQIMRLTTMRDAILPKLMNGDIQVVTDV